MQTLIFLMAASSALAADNSLVVDEVQNGRTVTLVVSSATCTEATITIDAHLTNMTSSAALPVTIDLAGRTRVELVSFSAGDAGKKWGYRWNGSWKYGSRLKVGATPDNYVYSLPYRSGRRQVIQGARGTVTHLAGSSEQEAIDFEMPVGTPVSAARAGEVVAIRSDCSENGLTDAMKQNCNYVVIGHSDGTFAEYLHLSKDGVLVHLGDLVKVNQTIALSGNTGYSYGPHLHFMVFYNIDGSTRKSVPVQFGNRNASYQVIQGGVYAAGQ